MKIAIAENRCAISDALRQPLALRPGHDIIWVAHTGAEAVERCARRRPDLLLMELVLPLMDAIEATRLIMKAAPCAIVIVTRGLPGHSAAVFQAIGQGALDAVDLSLAGRKSIAGVVEFRRTIDGIAALLATASAAPAPDCAAGRSSDLHDVPLVVLGASAGGPAAVACVLRQLPADFPAALVIVQHMQVRLARGFAEWLQAQSRLAVRVAAENDAPEASTALIAYPNAHLRFKRADRLGYASEPHGGYRPCIDVLFQSVGAHWPGRAAGVLLAGISPDGAAGLRAMSARGHYTIAQDRATSILCGMPGAAAGLAAAAEVLPVEHIAERLIEFARVAQARPTLERSRVEPHDGRK